MKDALMLFAGVALVFGAIVYGIHHFAKTQYAVEEKSQEELNADLKAKASRRDQMRDIEQRRKDLMRQQKQRIRDMQRSN